MHENHKFHISLNYPARTQFTGSGLRGILGIILLQAETPFETPQQMPECVVRYSYVTLKHPALYIESKPIIPYTTSSVAAPDHLWLSDRRLKKPKAQVKT